MQWSCVPLSQLQKPKTNSRVIRDCYWLIDCYGNALVYHDTRGASPQCNRNRTVISDLVDSDQNPAVGYAFVPSAFFVPGPHQ